MKEPLAALKELPEKEDGHAKRPLHKMTALCGGAEGGARMKGPLQPFCLRQGRLPLGVVLGLTSRGMVSPAGKSGAGQAGGTLCNGDQGQRSQWVLAASWSSGSIYC